MKNFKFSSSANGKVFRNGLYSTAILAAAIVLAVLINLLVGAIPKKYTEFDLSAAKMYTLGDSSRQLMQSLDQDVTVYYHQAAGSLRRRERSLPLGAEGPGALPDLCSAVRRRECIHRQSDRGQR